MAVVSEVQPPSEEPRQHTLPPLKSHHGSSGPVRLPQLDFLRGVAILMVLLHHSIVMETSAGRLTPLALFFARFGWTGVDLFFVLSGFLIGGLLFNEIIKRGSLDVRRFVIRRGFKIWPAYFALVLYCMLVRAHEKHSVADAFRQYWPNLLHIQNYRLTPAIHTWSLSVEEHFYLLLPLLIIALRRWFPSKTEVRFLPVIAISTFVICLVLRVHACWHTPYNFEKQMSPTHLRMDSLFFGVLLAWFYNFRPHWRTHVARYRGILFIGGLLLLIPMMIYTREESFFVPTFGVSFAAVGYSMILIATVLTAPGVGFAGRLIKSRVASVVEYVGLYSYSIYLWHMDLMRGHLKNWLHPFFDHQKPELRYVLFNLTFIVVAIVSGIVMAKLIESPSLKLRDRLFPARAGAMQSNPQRVKAEDTAITSPV